VADQASHPYKTSQELSYNINKILPVEPDSQPAQSSLQLKLFL